MAQAQNRTYATGKRKTAVARVWISPGTGQMTVNTNSADSYFERETSRMIARQSLELIEALDQFSRYQEMEEKYHEIGAPKLFETMQVYLGSLYVNDFNLFGRTWQVVAQADSKYRDRPEDITRLKSGGDVGGLNPRVGFRVPNRQMLTRPTGSRSRT